MEKRKGEENMRSKTDRQICGTCQYWTGKREPVFDAKGNPKIDITDEEGNCENVSSRFYDKKRMKQAKCKYYSKWTEIL